MFQFRTTTPNDGCFGTAGCGREPLELVRQAGRWKDAIEQRSRCFRARQGLPSEGKTGVCALDAPDPDGLGDALQLSGAHLQERDLRTVHGELHRIGEPMDVAGAVVFLASPAASLITGDTILIDGGWTAR